MQQAKILPKYSWLGFYEEMLAVICKKYDKRSLKILFDKFDFGCYQKNEFIDPLTFIAFFNIGGEERRKSLCVQAKQYLNLKENPPEDFSAIPLFDSRNPVFFKSYTNDFDDSILDILWSFAREVNSGKISSALFNQCLDLYGVGIVKLSQFLFIVKPEKFYPCDFYTRTFLNIEIESNDWSGYEKFQQECKNKTSWEKPYFVSYKARFEKNDEENWQKALDEDEKYSSTTSNFSTIYKPDKNEDCLNRKKYATALSNLIKNKNTRPPLNIGICANWGEGKSYLIELLKNELKKPAKKFQKETVFVDFDAWQYDNRENIWASMLMAIVGKCQKNIKQGSLFYLKYLFFQFKKNLTLEKFLMFIFLAFALGFAQNLFKLELDLMSILILSFFGIIAPDVIKHNSLNVNASFFNCLKMPNYQEHLGFRNGIEEIVNLSLKHLSNNGKKRIVLFIDNLDRCSKENITEILEAISKFLNICNFDSKNAECAEIVSVLAIDYEIIADAVVEVKKIDPCRCDEYLDKIINFPFFIPKANDISGLLNKYLKVEKQEIQSENLSEESSRDDAAEISQNSAFEPVDKMPIVENDDKSLLTLDEKEIIINAFSVFQEKYKLAPRFLEKMLNMYIVFKSVIQDKKFEHDKVAWWFAFTFKLEKLVDKIDIDSVRNFLKSKPQLHYENFAQKELSETPFVETPEFEELFCESAIFLKPLTKREK